MFVPQVLSVVTDSEFTKVYFFAELINLVRILNSAINIVFYLFMSKSFRDTFRTTFLLSRHPHAEQLTSLQTL